MLRKLWKDECGAILSMELVVIASVLVIAMIVAWALLRSVLFVELHNQAEWIAGDQKHIKKIEIEKITTASDVFDNNGEGDPE